MQHIKPEDFELQKLCKKVSLSNEAKIATSNLHFTHSLVKRYNQYLHQKSSLLLHLENPNFDYHWTSKVSIFYFFFLNHKYQYWSLAHRQREGEGEKEKKIKNLIFDLQWTLSKRKINKKCILVKQKKTKKQRKTQSHGQHRAWRILTIIRISGSLDKQRNEGRNNEKDQKKEMHRAPVAGGFACLHQMNFSEWKEENFVKKEQKEVQ